MDGTGARDLGAVVLGLDGFGLVAVDEHDVELELAVQTTNDMVGSPGCGAVAAARLPTVGNEQEWWIGEGRADHKDSRRIPPSS